MGTLTLAELKEEVRAGLGNRTDLDSRLTRILNLAQQRVARLHDFDEMERISTSSFPFTNSPADKYITLPGLRELYSLKLIDGQQSAKLTQLTQRMWNRLIPAPQEYVRGRPSQFMIWNNSCILHPLADQPYDNEIFWTIWPTPFVDSSPTLTSDYKEKDEILIELALVYAFNSLGKVEQAQTHWNRARPLLVEAVNTDQEKPDLEILPGPGLQDLGNMLPQDYWNDPFVKDAP